MRILYECRGITLADTGEGYEVLKDGRTHLTGIGTPREAVVSYCAVLESEMLRRVERYEQRYDQKKKAEL